MDLTKLSLADRLVSIGAFILIISTFLPWYGSSASSAFVSGSSRVSLWSTEVSAFFIFLAAVVALVIILLRLLDVMDLDEQGIPESLAILAVAVFAGLITIIRVLFVPGGSFSFESDIASVSYGRQWGMWIGLGAATLFVAGAVMKFLEERV